MAQKVIDAAIVELAGEQLTVNANSGNRIAYNIPTGTQGMLIEPQAAMRLNFVPAIRKVIFYNASNSGTNRWIDLTEPVSSDYWDAEVPNLINGARNTSAAYPGDTGENLNSMTTSDFIYVGIVRRIGGVHIDVVNTNGTSSTLSAEYSAGGGFTSTAITDGTASGGATLAQDGAVTIDTVPSRGDWKSVTLEQAVGLQSAELPPKLRDLRLYWLRLSVGTGLDSSVSVQQVTPLHRNAMGGAASNEGGGIFKASTEYDLDYRVPLSIPHDVGAIEVLSQATATNVNVTWIRRV